MPLDKTAEFLSSKERNSLIPKRKKNLVPRYKTLLNDNVQQAEKKHLKSMDKFFSEVAECHLSKAAIDRGDFDSIISHWDLVPKKLIEVFWKFLEGFLVG